MNGNRLVYKIWEFACVGLIKTPLNAKHDQDDEDGRVAIDFLHMVVIGGLLKIQKRPKKAEFPAPCGVDAGVGLRSFAWLLG
jgi:hypothetical protein